MLKMGVIALKKKISLVVLSLAMICSLTACGGNTVSYNDSAVYEGDVDMDYLELTTKVAPSGSSMNASVNRNSGKCADTTESKNNTEDRKLIRTIRLEIRVPSSDLLGNTVESLKGLADNFDGYVTNNDIDYGSSYAGGEIVVRIPKDNADSFLNQVESSGLNVISLSDSSDDVTLEYSDVSTALEVQKIKREKYLEYLEQARDIDEILAIEDRLSDVVTQIEQYQSRLLILDNQIDYTRVSIRISCTTSKSRDSLGERVKQRFGEIGSGFIETLLDGLEWATGAIATLVFTLPIILGVMFIGLKVVMKAVRRKESQKSKNEGERKLVRFFKNRVRKEKNTDEHKQEGTEE